MHRILGAVAIAGLLTGCFSSRPTMHRPAYIVDGVIVGLSGVMVLGAIAGDRGNGDAEGAPMIVVGSVGLAVGLVGLLINHAVGVKRPPPAAAR